MKIFILAIGLVLPMTIFASGPMMGNAVVQVNTPGKYATINVGGDAAKALYETMTDVVAVPDVEEEEILLKKGKMLACTMVDDGVDSQYFCSLTVLSNGTVQPNAVVVPSNDFEEALIEACGDHSSTPAEVEACKQQLLDLCLDHEATPGENLACIKDNDAL